MSKEHIITVLLLLATVATVVVARERRDVPGVDYPALHAVPSTGFSCQGRYPGYYADDSPISRCQVFHYCYPDGLISSFLCPNTTIFNQRYFVCDYFHNFDCATAQKFYNMNKMFFQPQEEETEKSTTEKQKAPSDTVKDYDYAEDKIQQGQFSKPDTAHYDYSDKTGETAQYPDYGDTYDTLFEPSGPRTLEEAKLPFGFKDFGG